MKYGINLNYFLQVGPTQVGKSSKICLFLEQIDKLMSVKPVYIKIFLGEKEPKFDKVAKSDSRIKIYDGLPIFSDLMEDIRSYRAQPGLVVFDDLANDLSTSGVDYLNLLQRGGSHNNLSTVLVSQTLFCSRKNNILRQFSLQSHYTWLFKSKRDLLAIGHLSRQILGPSRANLMVECYRRATSEPYDFLLIRTHPRDADQIMFVKGSSIFDKSPVVVYSI